MPLAPQCLCLFVAGGLAVVQGMHVHGGPELVPVELLAIEATDRRLDLAIDGAVRELHPVKPAPPRIIPRARRRGQAPTPAGMRWHYGSHHKSGTVMLDELAVEHGRVMQKGHCWVRAGMKSPLPPDCVRQRDRVSVWFWSHITQRLIGDIANDRIDWSDVYHRNHTNWRDPGHLPAVPPGSGSQGGPRAQAEAPSRLRGVMIIRDPISMVLSAYVYHLKSNEVPALNKIRRMSVEDGLALVVRYTLDRGAREMLDAYRSLPEWVMPVRFEGFTRSSESFDETAAAVYEYMLGDVYTEEERARLLESAKLHDLHRHPHDAGDAHVSDNDLEQKVRSTLQRIPKEYLDPLMSWRAFLGY